MLRFLSDEWIAALDAAAATSTALDGAIGGDEVLVVEHVVHDGSGGDGAVAFHLRLGSGPARVRPGHADDPTVTFTQSRATAQAIASGTTSAQAAFMAGALRLGGRVDLLIEHHGALAEVDDVFAAVRERTDWSDPGS